MFQRLAALISKLMASASRGLGAALDLAIKPLQSLFGSGGGGSRLAPEFDPAVSPLDLLDQLHEEQEPTPAPVHRLNRDGVETVLDFLKATKAASEAMDLKHLPVPLRATLISMSDEERSALSAAGLGAVRKFIDGRDHGVHGVPHVVPVAPTATAVDEIDLKRRVRAALRQEGQSKPFVMPKRLPAPL